MIQESNRIMIKASLQAALDDWFQRQLEEGVLEDLTAWWGNDIHRLMAEAAFAVIEAVVSSSAEAKAG